MNLERLNVEFSEIQSLKCEKHQKNKALFICISHQDCQEGGLFCLECFDSLPPNHPHHLISVGRFEIISKEYGKYAVANSHNLRQTLQLLKDQFSRQIDIIEHSTLSLLENRLKRQRKQGQIAFKQEVHRTAPRNIWERLHELQSSKTEFEKEVNKEIKSHISPIMDLIDRLNSIFNTIDPNNSGSFCQTQLMHSQGEQQQSYKSRRLRERRNYNCKIPELQSPKTSKKLGDVDSWNGKQFSEQQKQKIVSKIGKSMSKSKLARVYNIAYSTLRKWELKYWKDDRGKKKKSQKLRGNRYCKKQKKRKQARRTRSSRDVKSEDN